MAGGAFILHRALEFLKRTNGGHFTSTRNPFVARTSVSIHRIGLDDRWNEMVAVDTVD
jgi:hypothetical protein